MKKTWISQTNGQSCFLLMHSLIKAHDESMQENEFMHSKLGYKIIFIIKL